ncbi:MAG: hypothetical protein JSU07_11720 [Bacteroidetes bacterium]|nr:hypothetical protein [Bacteroidota bacterium]
MRLGQYTQVYTPSFNKNFNYFKIKDVILTVAGACERTAGACEKIAGRRFVNKVWIEKTAEALEKTAVRKCVKAAVFEKNAGRKFVKEVDIEKAEVISA